jgi:hypothetical protein
MVFQSALRLDLRGFSFFFFFLLFSQLSVFYLEWIGKNHVLRQVNFIPPRVAVHDPDHQVFELLVVRVSNFMNLILLYCSKVDGTDIRSGCRVIAGENKLD